MPDDSGGSFKLRLRLQIVVTSPTCRHNHKFILKLIMATRVQRRLMAYVSEEPKSSPSRRRMNVREIHRREQVHLWSVWRVPPLLWMVMAAMMVGGIVFHSWNLEAKEFQALLDVVETRVNSVKSELESEVAQLKMEVATEDPLLLVEQVKQTLAVDRREVEEIIQLKAEMDLLKREQEASTMKLRRELEHLQDSKTLEAPAVAEVAEWNWANAALGSRIVHGATTPTVGFGSVFENAKRKIAAWFPHRYSAHKTVRREPEIILDQASPLVPGRCYAFAGKEGQVTIQLPLTTNVTSVGLVRLPGSIGDGSPRVMSVSIDGTTVVDREVVDWSFTETLWTLAEVRGRLVSFHFHENYGAEFTCIYRAIIQGSSIDHMLPHDYD